MMARRRKIKSLGEIGVTLIAIGVGVLTALTILGTSPFAALLQGLRPWAWLSVSLGAFFLGLRALRSPRGSGFDRAPVEPVFEKRQVALPRQSDQSEDALIDNDMRNRWRPPELVPNVTVRPTAWSLAVFDLIEWRRFEALCEALLQREGLITSSQAFGADGGIDIRLYSDTTKTQLTGIVQCKNWSDKNWVGEVKIREFLGLKTDHQVATAIFITSSTFTPAAQTLASRHGIALLDGIGLLRRIQAQPTEVQQILLAVATNGDFQRATCVKCGTKMTLRTNSTNGNRFWSCTRCGHTMSARQIEVAV